LKRKNDADRVKEQVPSYPDPESEFMGMEYPRYELIEGVRYECSPAPTVLHQKISGSFYIQLYQTCHSNGTFLYSPVDVYLDADNQFQPDLVYIVHERDFIIKEKRIEGAPDLVLEILSPSSSQNDKIRKKRQYARFGVKEYWIVDPYHRAVDQFVLADDKYDLLETYSAEERLTSPLFPCISIDLGKVFEPIGSR
jgi:Uma2 family endonuclease